ncbi:M23 family metallopeptidase [Gracilibacillus sp. S3-1-1]|uniref:M23 family metallopeptidase n=1 Tax=Gracilibacillus pellucidus TaxID=3095368 RepID=A0ACC6M6G1_9BACI|nr:M23 family metallopeptidase [Gracilibacillus sp. S3-1-1]MDX8046558.1 M23 family metallopeptidase [Gracilibacillus sp. S3-1-1]
MKKNNLSQIRQNITKRKASQKRKTTPQVVKMDNNHHVKQAHMEDEERHGYYSPTYSEVSNKREQAYFKPFLMKSLIAAGVFFVTVFSVNSNQTSLEQPRNWIHYAMTEEFPFATVHSWYLAQFGAPFALEANLTNSDSVEQVALPVSGHVNQTFQENGEGILISAEQETSVVAVQAGTVLFAGNDRETGKTVVIQHADRSKSIYGHLSNLDVHSYQSIQANQEIGTYEPSDSNESMYFAIEKNRTFLDPIRVIQVDEQS